MKDRHQGAAVGHSVVAYGFDSRRRFFNVFDPAGTATKPRVLVAKGSAEVLYEAGNFWTGGNGAYSTIIAPRNG